jgi:AcrR family transcriptional regulator
LPDVSSEPIRRRLPADERRAVILEAARRLFARNGYHATGTGEIAAAAGCSEPIIYKHFASKQALFGAVLEECALEMRGALDRVLAEHDDPLDAYASFARGFVREVRFIEITRVRTLALSLTDEPEIHDALQRVSQVMRGRWEEILHDGQRTGHVRRDIDIPAVCLLGLGVTLTAGYLQALGHDKALERLPGMVDAVIALLRPPLEEGRDAA